MNAALMQPGLRLEPMTVLWLDAVVSIENIAYPFPWTRGNFIDSLAAGYLAEVLVDGAGLPIGYYVAMAGVEEMHLLNITVAPAYQGRGHSLTLLDRLVRQSRAHAARMLWLEVRESNARARGVYARYGFTQVGLRRAYYPAAGGTREDAVVMSLPITAEEAGHGLD
jgi:ribosomal-protein-alanine N-acetyltransferase